MFAFQSLHSHYSEDVLTNISAQRPAPHNALKSLTRS